MLTARKMTWVLQVRAPINYAPKTLAKTQQKYLIIEKEMLAIIFSCQRCYQYLYGRYFLIESNYMPLGRGGGRESIFEKPLGQCPFRLQQWRISLLDYAFRVKFVPLSQKYIADALSRT